LVVAFFLGLAVWVILAGESWRDSDGRLMGHDAPLMKGIVPLLFLLFLVPGVIFGAITGSIRNHRDVIQAMSKSMGAMSYYLVMAFFAAHEGLAPEWRLACVTGFLGALTTFSSFSDEVVGIVASITGASSVASFREGIRLTYVIAVPFFGDCYCSYY
jgi:hypothetical protein